MHLLFLASFGGILCLLPCLAYVIFPKLHACRRCQATGTDVPYSSYYKDRVPVFSRPLHIDKVPSDETVTCRIRANDAERRAIAKELELEAVISLTANVTARYTNPRTILVSGIWKAEAQLIKHIDSPDIFSEEFEMTWLTNHKAKEPVEYNYQKWDDEVPSHGNIDIATIVLDHFEMNLDTE